MVKIKTVRRALVSGVEDEKETHPAVLKCVSNDFLACGYDDGGC